MRYLDVDQLFLSVKFTNVIISFYDILVMIVNMVPTLCLPIIFIFIIFVFRFELSCKWNSICRGKKCFMHNFLSFFIFFFFFFSLSLLVFFYFSLLFFFTSTFSCLLVIFFCYTFPQYCYLTVFLIQYFPCITISEPNKY